MQKLLTEYFPRINPKRTTIQKPTVLKLPPFDRVPNELLCRIFLYASSSTFNDPELPDFWDDEVHYLNSY